MFDRVYSLSQILFVIFLCVGFGTFVILKLLKVRVCSGTDAENGSGTFGNRNYEFVTIRGKHHSFNRVELRMTCNTPGKFKIEGETITDRFFKTMQVAVEFQTGDSEFDRDFYIYTDDLEFTRLYLDLPRRRLAIRHLLQSGFDSIAGNGKNIVCVLTDEPTEGAAAFCRDKLSDLSLCADDIPATPPLSLSGMTALWWFRRCIAYTVPAAVLFPGFYGRAMTHEVYESERMFLVSCAASLPLMGAVLLSLALLISGRSSSHRVLLNAAIISLFAFPFAGYECFKMSNEFYDNAPAVTHVQKIVDRRTAKPSRRSHVLDYYAVYESWHGGRAEYKVTKSTYDGLVPNQSRAVIVAKPGHLGFEWLDSFRVE